MLLSIISSSATQTVSYMVTIPGLPQYGSDMVVGLIALLSLKEVLSASKYWNKLINSSFNVAIIPLLLSFTAIVIFKVSTIL
ncbi:MULTISPECIES: hypothetical protein [unclassified Methanosarcina]|uniref:hypothetical protein n=1 Tax=unclassified Methanosarcina TaxID=2644672 RepID=UPI00064F2307|nr:MULTISPECIES: hypothetical protein [unclassified Methanosarcina]